MKRKEERPEKKEVELRLSRLSHSSSHNDLEEKKRRRGKES